MDRKYDECSACGDAVTTRLDAVYCHPCMMATEAQVDDLRRELREAVRLVAVLVKRLGGAVEISEKEIVDRALTLTRIDIDSTMSACVVRFEVR